MKRAILGFGVVVGCILGCGQEPAKPKAGNVEVNVPGVSVKVGPGGAEVKAPGVEVKSK